MDVDRNALPDDIVALKDALLVERARALEVTAELMVARAKASEDVALIAQQKLRIAKLERQVYGQRSERSARLIDQLALEFERAGGRRHGGRTCGGGGGRQDNVGARIYAQAS
jgi:transposase